MVPQSSFAGLIGAFIFCSSISHVTAFLEARDINYNVTGFDIAPDYSHDPAPPYPPLTDDKGQTIDAQSLRGTRLFGWKGCGTNEIDDIKQAYNDFYTLAQQPEVYNNIDWTSQAAKEFWGAATGKNAIPDDRRKQILQIYAAAQQVYNYPWTWQPPWLSWRHLWIEVRCSGGDETGDPDNICRDKQPDDGTCPSPPGTKPPADQKSDMEAYSDNASDDLRYSRITFCNRFFNNLVSLGDAVTQGKTKSTALQNNLETWNNRARCFFHEITHLDYFMNAPDKSPYVDDLQIRYKKKGIPDWYFSYGPYNAKVLRNWIGNGFYTQRNADSYAYFVLAKYIEKQIGRYPNLPTPGSFKPMEAPKDRFGNPIQATGDETTGVGQDLIGTQDIEPDQQDLVPDFTTPGCSDKSPSSPVTLTGVPAKTDPQCPDKNALSGVPFDVFSGSGSSVYGTFCNAAEVNIRKLSWTFDSHGNLIMNPSKNKRASDPNNYKTFNFELDWTPKSNFNPDLCNRNCMDAYAAIAASPCGHQGADKNQMTVAGSVDIGCGTYAYKITGPDVPKPPTSTPPQPTPTATAPYVTGTGDCHIHVNEYWLPCITDSKNLAVQIDMWDTAGKPIGHVDQTNAGAGNSLFMKSKLEDALVVTPEHQNDYIQFTLGGLSWTSGDSDKSKSAWCSLGGWDPREGPACGRFLQTSKRQMDCYFKCPWNGGKPSDGS